jgi:hypothetical protein
LKIYYGPKSDFQFFWNNNRKLRAYVSFKSVYYISGSGGSDVTVNGTIKVPELKLSLSGGSDFKGEVDVTGLEVHQSGGADVNISARQPI